jgi:sugar-specific transcriptional regulator TrmB
MLEDTLGKMGFSPSEIRLFMHLNRNGAGYATRLSQETGLNRTNVYEALDRLVAKGLVSFVTQNNVKWYAANPPESVLSLIQMKEEELAGIKKDLVFEINILKPNPSRGELEARIFVGKYGLRMLFEEILEKGKPISVIASKLQFSEFFGPYFEAWHKARIQKGIKQRSIFPRSLKSKLKDRKLLQYRFSDDESINPTTTILYGENCLFIQWAKEPIAIKIQNKDVAHSHLNYFNRLWKS